MEIGLEVESVAPADDRPRAAWYASRTARWVLIATYLSAFLWAFRAWGLPLERPILLAWLMGGAMVLTWGRGTGGPLAVLRDWLPYGLAMTAYDFTRGAADGIGMPVQVQLPILLDKLLFFGKVPSVVLQQAVGGFADPDPAWWEVPMALTYTSHFVVPFVIPAVLWVRHRERFRAWRARFFTVVVMGLVTYVLLPAAPPWMASQQGELPPLQRAATRGWSRLGLHVAQRVFDYGNKTVNVVAALPSLHTAFAAMATVFFWRSVPRWARPLLAAYPLMMAFTLIVGGEHYLCDVVLAWVYVAAAMIVWRRIDERRAGASDDHSGVGVYGATPE